MNNLQKIQNYLKENNISLFIVNRTDEFLNEYIAPYAERLEWISNFSGSAGRAIIQQNKAFIFIDGRYTFQAHKQVDAQYYNIEHLKDYWKYLENKIQMLNFYLNFLHIYFFFGYKGNFKRYEVIGSEKIIKRNVLRKIIILKVFLFLRKNKEKK